jgi:carbon storage regulator CsrA
MGLVLQRLEGQSIAIGPDVKVTVLLADRGRCRLLIEAPKAVGIWRCETLTPGAPTPPGPAAPRARAEGGE